MKAVLCPVCNGSGKVPNGFYAQTVGYWYGTDFTPETCRGCDGKGWVEVAEAHEFPKSWESIPDLDGGLTTWYDPLVTGN